MAVPLLDKRLSRKGSRNPRGHRATYSFLSRTYCAEISLNISKKRKEIVECAAQIDVVVTNKLARLRSQEDE